MRCNRSCSYCFAKEKINSYPKSSGPQDISMENVDKVLDFLEKDNFDTMQLAGGEPTLHPKFDEILMKILNKGIHLNVLSNTLWDPKKNKLFSDISSSNLGFLLNIDHPNTYNSNEWERIVENLLAIRGRKNVSISFNISEKVPKYEYIFEIISNYEFKNLRLSFSMPVVYGEAKNQYLPLSDYKALAPFVMNFYKRAEHMDVGVTMDNTVPLCMFSENEIGKLLLNGVIEAKRNFVCFPAIDIGPDLSVWRCFGTSGLSNRKIEDFRSPTEVYEYYDRISRPYQFNVFELEECYDCEYAKKKMCQGGCNGYSIAKSMELGMYPLETKNEDILELKPTISENVSFKIYNIPKETFVLSHDNGEIMEFRPLMRQLFDLFNGNRSVRDAIKIYMNETKAAIENENPLDIFLKNVAIEEVLPTIRDLLDRGFLVQPKT
jgi:radical SAM protein with 4Fe4S-binding SPASM domain